MSSIPKIKTEKGPFRANQVTPGSRYELTKGHPVWCSPGGGRHANSNTTGALSLSTDPLVDEIGIDVGYTPSEETLRAPDIGVGHVPLTPGWVEGVPPLAVEYADTGSDENDLQQKIRELLGAGTKYIWIVRLVGPRRVEVYKPNQPMKIAEPGSRLTAPGILQNELPMEALYERNAALETALRNLLQRRGYKDLNAIRQEGISQGEQLDAEQTLIQLFELKLGKALTTQQIEALRNRLRVDGKDVVHQMLLTASVDNAIAWLQ